MKPTSRGRWLVFVCLLVVFLSPILARAEAGKNQNRGFSVDKVYAVGEIDSVNVFNGNLIVRIPLGPEYSIGPSLRYQFQLVYNSTIWDYRELLPATTGRIGDPPPGLRQAVPEDYSNVGMGWYLSLGRLLLPNENRDFSYIGPDGAQHEFKSATNAPVVFTEDGSYLRLRKINDEPEGMHYEIDFPDGSVRTFSDTGLLQEIKDQYGNWVRVDMTATVWTITDGHDSQPSGRAHHIYFTTTPARVGAGSDGYPDYTPSVISRIELAAPASAPGPIEYSFEQVQHLIGRGGNGDRYFSQPSKCLGAPMLEQIHLPDGTTYTPSYNLIAPGTESVTCGGDELYDANEAPAASGAMNALVLPTRGKIEWDYDTVYLNESICGKSAGGYLAPMNGPKVKQRFVGVEERRLYSTPTMTDAQAAKWTYTRTLVDPFTGIFVRCGEKREDKSNEGEVSSPADELIVTVQAPDGLTSKHYFSVWPAEADGATDLANQPSSQQSGQEYGLPLTRKRSPIAVTGKPTLYLSSQTFDANAPSTPLRESYVHYETDWNDVEYRTINSRVRDERSTFPTDNGCGGMCYTEVRRSLFDERGHYKQTDTSSNFPDSKSHSTFTGYTTPALNAEHWILGLYDESWETDGGADTRTLRRFTVFNDKGAMESVRTEAQTGNADDDVLSVWCRDANTTAGARGFVTSERMFGAGRSIPASYTSACGASRNPAGDYFINHTYTFGQGLLLTHKTAYAGANFNTSDETYEPITGVLLSTKDTAEFPTTYEYDDIVRLESVHVPDVAPVRYYYTRDSYPNSVAVVTEASAEKRDVHYFDGLGRPMLSKAQVVDGWSTTCSTYDQSGRVSTVSMPELRPNSTFETFNPAFQTTTTYDVLGRAVTVVQPDAKLAVTEYVNKGDREKKNGTKESAGQQNADIQSIEHLDGAGRLVKVAEPSGPNGAYVDTTYTYDVGGHLATVKTESDVVENGNTDHVIQNRSFIYDLRGFLTEERHPEKGALGNGSVVYGDFDSKGHARSKTEGSIVTSFAFDESERLEAVRDGANQDIKTFLYGTPSDCVNCKGKLHVATRYNRLASAGTIRVRETYTYAGLGGRMSHKQTVVARQDGSDWPAIQTFDQGYDYEPDYGAVNAITYPSCTSCTMPASAISTLPLGYDHGLLTSVGDFATLRYHANGMVKTVQRNHPLTTLDRYESDHGMTRPSSIQFDDGDACRPVTGWANNQSVNSGETVTFQVTVVPGANVTWYSGTSGDISYIVRQDGSASYTTDALTQSARFWCRVTLPGGCSVDSPTFVAEVCRMPEIVSPAADIAPPAQPAKLNQPVYADVVAVASGITYTWAYEELKKETNGTYTTLGAPQTIAGANGPSVSWTPTTRGTHGFWGLRVTVSGSCPGAMPQSRLIKVIEIPVPDSTVCEVPDPLNHLPPERRVWWPSHSIDLDITIENPTPGTIVYQWSLNGHVAVQGAGLNVFTTSLANLQPKLVTLRMWRDCSYETPDAQGNPTTVVVLSEMTPEQSTYLWSDENCPIPPLSVDQPELIVDPVAPNAKFTASSVWPSVNFQWFKGDSGNTSNPQAAEPTSAGRSLRPSAPGTYWVRATSRCGTTADSPTLIARDELCAPVQFIRQPAPHTNTDAGSPVSLSFETYSDPAVTSQEWRVDGEAAVISTAAILTESPTRTTTYYVEARNGCNVGVSAKAMVHVTSCNAIQVLQAPQPASINKGDSVLLSVSATSSFPLTYQWFEGETGDIHNPVPNGAAASITVAPLKSTKYWVRIDAGENTCAIDSSAVPVTVCREPEFVGEVFDRNSPIPGVMHWLEADVDGDNLSYAWYSGLVGDETTLLSSGRSIVLHPMTTTEFWLRVTSDCAAPLADRSIEAQYSISVCPEIVTQPYAVQPKVMPGTPATLMIDTLRGDTIEWYIGSTLVGYGATFQTANLNATTTYYAKVKSGTCVLTSDPVTVSLCDQPTVGWNTAAVRVTKAQQQTLSVHSTSSGAEVNFKYYSGTPGNVAQSTLLQSDSYGTLGVHPDTTTTYWVRAQEATGCYADTPGLTVDVCIPQILTQPVSATIDPQTSTQLSVAIDLPASSRITYQWYIGPAGNTSQAVSGGTNASLTVSPTVDTTYWVRITSVCNTGTPYVVDSTAATVTVCKAPAITQQPTSINGYAGIASSLQVVATGTELTYQWYRGASGDTSNAVANATSASFSPVVSQTTDYWVKISGRCGSINSNTARVSIAPVITAQPVGGPVTKGTSKTLTVTATGSYLTYQWYSGTGTANPINGATNSSYPTPALNADASYWVRVASGAQTVDSNVATFTVCQPRTFNVTYSTKVSGSSVLLEVIGAAAEETYEWYQGATLISTGTYVSVSPQQTNDYWLRTKRASCDADSAVVTVRVCTPKINTQPQSGSALSGTSTTLTVAAQGTGPLTYQWFKGGAGDTSQPVGTNSPSYPTAALTTTTSYWVRVSSPAQSGCTVNSVDSTVATITICNVPAISSITANQRTTSGSSVTLTVTATGGTLQYEWHEGAVGSGPIVGTNSASLTVAPTSTKTYWVRVYNGCGTINSSAVQVSIYPTITQQPVDVAACNNGNAHFTITATGTGLSYAWFRQYPGQSAQAVGGNTNSLDLTATAAATVFCRVTSGDAMTVSNTVNLTVSPSPANYSLTKAVYSPTQWKLTATIAAADEGLVQYEWYRGALGDTSNRISVPINANLVVVTPPSLPTTYWVRVKYIDTGCPTDKAITVQ